MNYKGSGVGIVGGGKGGNQTGSWITGITTLTKQEPPQADQRILGCDWWILPLARDLDVISDGLALPRLLLQISIYPSAFYSSSPLHPSLDDKVSPLSSTNFPIFTNLISICLAVSLSSLVILNPHWAVHLFPTHTHTHGLQDAS